VPHVGPDEVVRRYLDAEARLEPVGEFGTGRFLAAGTLIEEANARAGVAAQQSVANVRSLSVRELAVGRAVVDVDAFVLHDLKSNHGGQTLDYRFRGPVTLVDEDGTWKITSLVIDGVTFPDGLYEPFIEQELAGCSVTMFAQPTKRGGAVFARVVNGTDQPVAVSEFVCVVPWARFLSMRWGSIDVPAVVEPGAAWTSVASWSPLSLRRRLRGQLVVDGEELTVGFVPARAHPWSWRARLRHIDRNSAILWSIIVLGIVNAVLTDGHGLGLLGIGLAGVGAFAACRGLALELAGFATPGSRVLASAGSAAALAACLYMATHALGWLGLGVVATVVFSMQRPFVAARYVRRRRTA
jgi:hypothetical protein